MNISFSLSTSKQLDFGSTFLSMKFLNVNKEKEKAFFFFFSNRNQFWVFNLVTFSLFLFLKWNDRKVSKMFYVNHYGVVLEPEYETNKIMRINSNKNHRKKVLIQE